MSDSSSRRVETCTPSTSIIIAPEEESTTTTADDPRKFCVNEIPWKLVPQTCDGFTEFEFLDQMEGFSRLSDVESFIWKWSPCGRYGIDLPGGRENINHQLKDRMAIFDLHTNSWTFYTMDVGFDIPRVCFLYWARNDIIGTVTLVKDDAEPRPTDDIVLKFRQTFWHVSHETQKLTYCGQCKYRTNKTILASYWFHIFENRRGEPFIDHNNQLWLIFSNGSDSLILLPYLPSATCFDVKYVSFDMNSIVSQRLGTRVYLDPFMSSHYVPHVYRNEINFFIRVDTFSFVEEEDRDYGQDPQVDDNETKVFRGVFHMRINLKDVIEREENNMKDVEDPEEVDIKFTNNDVEVWKKIYEDFSHSQMCISQHGKMVVLQKWGLFTIDTLLTKRLSTRVANLDARTFCCSEEPRGTAFCTIDLDSEQIKKFDVFILGTDVIQPHPSGTVYMFRYKELFGMSYCELPYFEPITLQLKCRQILNKCVHIDPAYSQTVCCLKYEEEDYLHDFRNMKIEEQ
ncbi:hypothetical protein GCK72_009282 [Caenorhabditis remanei]|uniref:Uncharacterized protein n=1 Tax=Caenorhabditis remanei TaxID=31234 RepID=A0A6A5GZV4_CAERE|nr:hypothetical protein GCK72_009282 [Caenorhabditis remanei]KAF1761028.1 hypothetical protein GCK72_009282 [Caenorhabditis remanei]